MKKIFSLILVAVLAAGIAMAVTPRKKTSRSTPARTTAGKSSPAGKARCAVIRFGYDDLRAVAADDRNVYVTAAWCKKLYVIDKASGAIKEVEHPEEVQSVAVAGGKCYYYVAMKGIYTYDAVTGQSRGPLPFNLELPLDSSYQGTLVASPDGSYLWISYGGIAPSIIDMRLGRIVGRASQEGYWEALNNSGGAAIGTPSAIFAQPDGKTYTISDNVVVRNIYSDPLTSQFIFSCEEGVGYTPWIPVPDAGMKRIQAWQELGVMCVNRDDSGNFIFGLKDGMALGGKTFGDPVKVISPFKTGVADQYGTEISMTTFRMILPDGKGNILAASIWNNCLVIFNPDGLNGYSAISGKYKSL